MKQGLQTVLVLLALLAFAGLGIAHIFWPDWFVKRSSVRKGGSMLAEWNRMNFQLLGAALAAVAIYFLYSLLKH